MNNNQLIEALEKTNMDYLDAISSVKYQSGEKIEKLKKNGLKLLFTSIIRHMQFKNIKQNFADSNLPNDIQKNMARMGKNSIKVAIYTCVTGEYDMIDSPYLQPSNVDYILYSDIVEKAGWKSREIPCKLLDEYSATLVNRYIKFHPFEFFEGEYDYAIYIDGNVLPISDLSVWCEYVNSDIGLAFHRHCSRDSIYEEGKACKILGKGDYDRIEEQLRRYKELNYPEKYGMLEGNIFVVDLKNHVARKILDELWNELINSESGRDQLAWPFILWKNGIKVDDVCSLGNDAYKNPKVRIKSHNK